MIRQPYAFPPQDPHRKRLGANLLAIFGTVLILGGLVYFVSSGMSAREAIVSLLPLAMLFALFVWAIRDSMNRVLQVTFVLALLVTAATVVVAFVQGD